MGLGIALPKGRLLAPTSALLEKAGLGLDSYTERSRQYRISSSQLPSLTGKVFQEKDIPVQVAIGNYQLGVCGVQWIEEYQSRYRMSRLVKVLELPYGVGRVCAAVHSSSAICSPSDLRRENGVFRFVSEYPNMAEQLALRLRVRRFKVYPVWGAAGAYLPENADVAVLWHENGSSPEQSGLSTLKVVLDGGACLVANARCWEESDMEEVVQRITEAFRSLTDGRSALPVAAFPAAPAIAPETASDDVWLALPDGHQQVHAAKFLAKAGLPIQGYEPDKAERRPVVGIPGVKAKVVRPQDMPQQVANGNFHLAITGRDWLNDHLYRFPSSPVHEVLDLGFGRVRLVAAMSGNEPVRDISELKQWAAARRSPLRVASEYVNIADRFARERHLAPYRVIPTWGATEAFIPEDADLLIENTETGRTLEENNIRIIETLAVSSACLIAAKGPSLSDERKRTMAMVVDCLRKGLVPA